MAHAARDLQGRPEAWAEVVRLHRGLAERWAELRRPAARADGDDDGATAAAGAAALTAEEEEMRRAARDAAVAEFVDSAMAVAVPALGGRGARAVEALLPHGYGLARRPAHHEYLPVAVEEAGGPVLLQELRSLPLHVALERRSDPALISSLLAAHPAAAATRSVSGRLPVELALATGAPPALLAALAAAAGAVGGGDGSHELLVMERARLDEERARLEEVIGKLGLEAGP